MSYTPVQNRFWSDGWVRGLNALDRYLFLYLLTNGRASLTGIYELPIDLMASESGIDEKDLRLSMLQRLEPKIYYKEGWVIIVNYPNHRVSNSPKLLAGIRKSFDELPKKIQEIALSYRYPIDTICIHIRVSRNRIDKNRIDTAAHAEKIEIFSDSEKKNKTTPEMKAVFALFTSNPARQLWKVRVLEREAAQILYDEYGIEELKSRYAITQKYKNVPLCPQVNCPSDFLEKMPKMETFLSTL